MENYLMNYDEKSGQIKGFYLKSIHGDNIPSPTIEVSFEKHDFYMQNNGKYKLNLQTLEDELIPIAEPSQSDLIKVELASLDDVLPRSVEDTWTALGLDTTKLPQVVQDRLARKIDLRNQLKVLTS